MEACSCVRWERQKKQTTADLVLCSPMQSLPAFPKLDYSTPLQSRRKAALLCHHLHHHRRSHQTLIGQLLLESLKFRARAMSLQSCRILVPEKRMCEKMLIILARVATYCSSITISSFPSLPGLIVALISYFKVPGSFALTYSATSFKRPTTWTHVSDGFRIVVKASHLFSLALLWIQDGDDVEWL